MIKPRREHFSATVDRKKSYIFGGSRESKLEGNVYSFNQQSKGWQAQAVKPEGRPHPSLHSGACASLGHCLYLYGGEIDANGSDRRPNFQDSLYQLDTASLEWTQRPNGPMKMVGSGMISYKDTLVLLGGYGYLPHLNQLKGEFIKEHNKKKYTDGRGWTNELHTFNVQTSEF